MNQAIRVLELYFSNCYLKLQHPMSCEWFRDDGNPRHYSVAPSTDPYQNPPSRNMFWLFWMQDVEKQRDLKYSINQMEYKGVRSYNTNLYRHPIV